MCSLHRKNNLTGASAWAGAVIAAGMLGTLLILSGGMNRDLFMLLNGLTPQTGGVFWAHVTIFGDGLVAFVLILPLVHRRPHTVWQLLIAAIIAMLLSNGLKQLLADIHRPPGVLDFGTFNLIGPGYSHHSFPSGHTTTVFTLAGVLIMHAERSVIRLTLLFAACLVGLSRVMVGIHWPADVTAGAAAGMMAAWAGCAVGRRLPQGTGTRSQQVVGVLLVIAGLVLLISHNTGYPQAVWLQRVIAVVCILGGWPVITRLFGKHHHHRQGIPS